MGLAAAGYAYMLMRGNGGVLPYLLGNYILFLEEVS